MKQRGPERRQSPGRRAGETGARPFERPPLETCPHCGSIVPAGEFCGHCGAHLTMNNRRRSHAFAAVPNGGVPELQTALDCRVDLTPHDLRHSVENLRPLLRDAALRRERGRRTRQRFESTFTHQAMTQAYLKALAI